MELIQQLKYFAGACEIFFGQHSAATASIKVLIFSIEKYKHIFKAREARETTFVSKFLFAIDTCMQMWLEECMSQPTRNRVDDSILNFEPVIDQVRFGSFDIILPPTFISKADEKEKTKPKKNKNGPDNNGTNRDGKNRRVVNSSPPDNFKLRTNEAWATHFANRLTGRVVWETTPENEPNIYMCARWLITGHCFANCHNAKSHVGASDIPPEKFQAFTTYMANCRSAHPPTTAAAGAST